MASLTGIFFQPLFLCLFTSGKLRIDSFPMIRVREDLIATKPKLVSKNWILKNKNGIYYY